MNPDVKRRQIGDPALEEEEDRISNLPRHLLSSILDCMLIQDAARTRVLSKTWKSIGETHPHIVLQRGRYCSFSMNKSPKVNRREFVRVVNSILLAHKGPIVKFVLFMPIFMHNDPYYHLWIKQLPEKGVKVLELENEIEYPSKPIPSYFFSCSELTRLVLVNCILNPPSKFGGFRNLTEILLQKVTFAAEMLFGAQVQHFELIDCAGIEHLDSQFTNNGKNIKILNVERSIHMEPYTHALDYDQYTGEKKSFDLHRLLGGMPSIEILTLNATSLEFLDPGLTLHNQLTTTMKNLKKLKLIKVEFDNVNVISNAFCLLRSMPILEHLEIKVDPDIKGDCLFYFWTQDMKLMKLKAERYLESLDCVNIIMNQLQTVVMQDVTGSRAEILVIKLLIASSPSLRSMRLMRSSTMNDPKEELRIVRELLQIPRKSAVQIFWS